MTREQEADLFFDFYRCPNTGRTIEANKHDDKVLCPCGRSNPAAKFPEAITGGAVHHNVSLLKRGSAAEWMARMDLTQKSNEKNP